MADVKISELPELFSLDGTEDLPIVDAGITKRTSTQAIADLAGLPYKIYNLSISYNGTSYTKTDLVKQIAGTVTAADVSSGKFSLTSSLPDFTSGKTFLVGTVYSNGGEPYFVAGEVMTASLIWVDLINFDGTQTVTPNFTNLFLEIRVYP